MRYRITMVLEFTVSRGPPFGLAMRWGGAFQQALDCQGTWLATIGDGLDDIGGKIAEPQYADYETETARWYDRSNLAVGSDLPNALSHAVRTSMGVMSTVGA